MNDEYYRRINLCAKAVDKATKKLKLNDWHIAQDFQGIEINIDTEMGEGKVIVLVGTGHGPRFPKYITLTVHGVVRHEVNSHVRIGGGGFERSENKFYPDHISQKWLLDAISKVSKCVKTVCSTKNMERLKKEALALRREETIKESGLARYQSTYLHATLPSNK